MSGWPVRDGLPLNISKLKRVFLGLLLLTIVGAGSAYWGWQQLNETLNVPAEGSMLLVPPGSTLSGLSQQLNEQDALSQPQLWTLFGRVTGQARLIHAGEYQLTPATTPLTLLQRMVSGDVHLHSITLVEGWRFSEALAAIRAHPAVSASQLTPVELMAELGKPDLHPEGQLLPETYRFPRGVSDVEIVRQAHLGLETLLHESWPERNTELPLKTPYEALTLASIVEKETALETERAQIAGVFVRRLNKRMRLETDPTVIYGLGETFDGNLRREDLRADTPYNTYRRAGLPPTPIALASAASIRAALHPADGDAMFFVATGAADGGHYFSSSYEEHVAAVSRYLRRLREQR